MKSHAQAVVIGGGVIGCSILYHLAKLGWNESVLLERDELTLPCAYPSPAIWDGSCIVILQTSGNSTWHYFKRENCWRQALWAAEP